MNEREYAALGAPGPARLMPLLNRLVTRRAMAGGQGAFYLATGAWPLLHMNSFEAVTGPKRDRWLVKTVGALVAVTGALLSAGAVRGRVSADLVGLAAGEAAALTGIDIVYVAKGRISKVYLLDALAELLLLAGWGHALAHERPSRGRSLAAWDAALDAEPLLPPQPPRSLPARLAALAGAKDGRAETHKPPVLEKLAGQAARLLPRRKAASPAERAHRMLKQARRQLPV